MPTQGEDLEGALGGKHGNKENVEPFQDGLEQLLLLVVVHCHDGHVENDENHNGHVEHLVGGQVEHHRLKFELQRSDVEGGETVLFRTKHIFWGSCETGFKRNEKASRSR